MAIAAKRAKAVLLLSFCFTAQKQFHFDTNKNVFIITQNEMANNMNEESFSYQKGIIKGDKGNLLVMHINITDF